MMSPTGIFLAGVLTVALLAIFVYVSVREMRRSPAAMMSSADEPRDRPERRAGEPDARDAGAGVPELQAPPPRPLRVLLATDGSPCGDRAVQSVAMRPWPPDSEIEVVSVVHTRVPAFPDPQLMIEAAHVEALEAERQRAPARVVRAQQCLAARPDLTVTTRVLEGNPEDEILQEAERWGADMIVVGSHGYGPLMRRVLGSVSQAVALHAPCSVEIVRCPSGESLGGKGVESHRSHT